MIISKLRSKLDGRTSLFDVRTTIGSNNKFDLEINSQGQLSRVIGIDKLAQHLLKYIMVKKGTYSNSSIGTSINLPAAISKNEIALKTDIVRSLTEYSGYQKASSIVDSTIIGYNIYRTFAPNDTKSWVKINKHMITNNFYFDSTVDANTTYYYSIVKIRNQGGKPVSEGVGGSFLRIDTPSSDTLNAVVGDNFIIVPKYSAVTLYWKKDVSYQAEEVLKSLTKINTWFTIGEPRELNLDLSLSNLENTSTQLTVTTV